MEVDPQMTVQRAHQIAHEVKERVRTQLPSVRDVLVHIEPAGQKTEMKTSRANARSSAAEA
jgi:divalent metal cation (Fe/Co/Zn/Cd) transporter